MKINRKSFLNQLESLQPGLSNEGGFEQSNCFVFGSGVICTFNDHIACSIPTVIAIEGAVQAKSLLALLHKIPDKEIDITTVEGELRITAKSRRAGLRMEKTLPLNAIENPEKWLPLPDDFGEALATVETCADNEDTRYAFTCIHICPDFLEASSGYQAARYSIETGLQESMLVPRDGLVQILDLGMKEIGESPKWLHFRNSDSLIISFRLHMGRFPRIAEILSNEGDPIILPKDLGIACKTAEIFSSDGLDSSYVVIELKEGHLLIVGEGEYGWYKEKREVEYTGPPLKFKIAPKLLAIIAEKYGDKCKIASMKLNINSGRFAYVTTLGRQT